MPRFKPVDYQQAEWIGVVFEEQILPGTFEYTLHNLIDHAVDLSVFEDRYQNDDTGAPAYSPAVLLKIILYAYSKGITSSRIIAECCEKNVTFMALSGNTRPHFTLIAEFVSSMKDEITSLFRDVLLVCDEEGLIGRDMFAVDGKHQVITHGEAFGTGQEGHLLKPMVEGTRETLQVIDDDPEVAVFEKTKLAADAGFHSETNMEWLSEENIDAYVADGQFRRRDPLFSTASRYKPKANKPKQFRPCDFTADLNKLTCTCPAGHPMYLENSNFSTRQGHKAICFRGWITHCRECHLRAECLRHPDQKSSRQVHFFTGQSTKTEETYTQKMKYKIDSTLGRFIYSKRIGTVEPVFANMRHAIGLDRFSLRGKKKVNIQWKLFCIVHNLLKIHRYGIEFG